MFAKISVVALYGDQTSCGANIFVPRIRHIPESITKNAHSLGTDHPAAVKMHRVFDAVEQARGTGVQRVCWSPDSVLGIIPECVFVANLEAEQACQLAIKIDDGIIPNIIARNALESFHG